MTIFHVSFHIQKPIKEMLNKMGNNTEEYAMHVVHSVFLWIYGTKFKINDDHYKKEIIYALENKKKCVATFKKHSA